MAVDDSCLILQEVTGEGGIRDDVGAAVVEHDVGQMGHARLHQLPAHGERHEAGVLTDHEQVERVAGGSGFFHKILMTEGKRVRVHDEGRTFALGPGLFQIAQIGPEAVAAVLHEDKGILHPGDLVEAEVAEKPGAFYLGVKKQVHIPPRALHLDEMGDDLVQQTLALMGAADGEAPQGVAEAAAGADDVVFLVEHGADVVQIAVAADALLTQQCVDLGQNGFIGRIDLRNGIFTHRYSPQ